MATLLVRRLSELTPPQRIALPQPCRVFFSIVSRCCCALRSLSRFFSRLFCSRIAASSTALLTVFRVVPLKPFRTCSAVGGILRRMLYLMGFRVARLPLIEPVGFLPLASSVKPSCEDMPSLFYSYLTPN